MNANSNLPEFWGVRCRSCHRPIVMPIYPVVGPSFPIMVPRVLEHAIRCALGGTKAIYDETELESFPVE